MVEFSLGIFVWFFFLFFNYPSSWLAGIELVKYNCVPCPTPILGLVRICLGKLLFRIISSRTHSLVQTHSSSFSNKRNNVLIIVTEKIQLHSTFQFYFFPIPGVIIWNFLTVLCKGPGEVWAIPLDAPFQSTLSA